MLPAHRETKLLMLPFAIVPRGTSRADNVIVRRRSVMMVLPVFRYVALNIPMLLHSQTCRPCIADEAILRHQLFSDYQLPALSLSAEVLRPPHGYDASTEIVILCVSLSHSIRTTAMR